MITLKKSPKGEKKGEKRVQLLKQVKTFFRIKNTTVITS
jgi:hypothetical protein